MKILLVEDSELNRDVVTNMLMILGCQVHSVGDGQQALDDLEQNDYDLVLMDCDMPVLDGFATTKAIRGREQAQAKVPVPIIALTAYVTTEHERASQQAGMNDYLTKPVYLKTLQALLNHWKDFKSSVGRVTTGDTNAVPTLDKQVIKQLQELMGVEMTLHLVERFLEYAPQQLDQLQQLLNEGDIDMLRRRVHQFKGETLQLGATRLGQLCKEIETLVLDGQSLAPFQNYLIKLREELMCVSQSLALLRGNHG